MTTFIRSFLMLTFLLTANLIQAQDIGSILAKGEETGAFWSVSVRSADGVLLESYNADRFIIPASNQKLFTTAAILDGLGGDYRFTTKIYAHGNIQDSVLIGDLIIEGSGDPSISGIFYDEDREFVFRSFANQLMQAGIKSIQGKIIADITRFDDQILPKGWDWEDLSFYYGVEINPLSFNNNAVDLTVTAKGEIGGKPIIEWWPYNTDYVTFYNRQHIVDGSRSYDEDYLKYLGKNEYHLGSDLPQGYIEEEAFAVSDAHLYFIHSFDLYLKRQGFKTTSEFDVIKPNSDHTKEEWKEVAAHTSVPVADMVIWTNMESDNFYTEMLLKALAAEKKGVPATFDGGLSEVRKFLGSIEVDTTSINMKDGSGMAGGNFTKTSVLSHMLVKMQNHPEFDTYFKSMSVAGIDGTIAHRMKGTPLYNNFRGKSGYIGGVRTLSGYFETADGTRLIVSLAANNFIGKVRPIDAIHEEILMYLYQNY
ncbi:MAG: D-alanyl-D-alanine carboxypeptidase/D-alanyl-D-alanine-endopeptidase [Balneolaceae bacterium]|nr:D-alanyl-D-alanine carboxypeptidase/D-alanyl-D-alanine-endopeptidase [Balneolaceae bacterium]